MAELQGKLVLVTGASTGIGRAAALRFLQRGARVIVTARSEDKLRAIAAEGDGGRVIAIAADVRDGPAMEELARRVNTSHGTPDVIVANAGIGLDALFVETTDELLERVFEVNVTGVVRSIRPFVDGMVRRGSGRILIVSSVVGKRGVPSYSAYSGSKFALHGIAEALRVELWRTGVTVGVICPSSTESEFHERKMRRGPAQKSTRVQKHSADSVARAIVRMAGSRRREIVLSPEGKFMAILNRWAPALLDRILWRALVRKNP